MRDTDNLCERVARLLRQTLDVVVSASSAVEQLSADLLSGVDGPLTQEQQGVIEKIERAGQKTIGMVKKTEQAFVQLGKRSTGTQLRTVESEEKLSSLFGLLGGLLHDLRPPICTIKGFSDILQLDVVDGPLTAQQTERIKRISCLGHDILTACAEAIETQQSLWMEHKERKH